MAVGVYPYREKKAQIDSVRLDGLVEAHLVPVTDPLRPTGKPPPRTLKPEEPLLLDAITRLTALPDPG